MSQGRTPFTAEGRRRLAKVVVEDGWPVRRAAGDPTPHHGSTPANRVHNLTRNYT